MINLKTSFRKKKFLIQISFLLDLKWRNLLKILAGWYNNNLFSRVQFVNKTEHFFFVHRVRHVMMIIHGFLVNSLIYNSVITKPGQWIDIPNYTSSRLLASPLVVFTGHTFGPSSWNSRSLFLSMIESHTGLRMHALLYSFHARQHTGSLCQYLKKKKTNYKAQV